HITAPKGAAAAGIWRRLHSDRVLNRRSSSQFLATYYRSLVWPLAEKKLRRGPWLRSSKADSCRTYEEHSSASQLQRSPWPRDIAVQNQQIQWEELNRLPSHSTNSLEALPR